MWTTRPYKTTTFDVNITTTSRRGNIVRGVRVIWILKKKISFRGEILRRLKAEA